MSTADSRCDCEPALASNAEWSARLRRAIPAGSHAYSKAENQWPHGCHVVLERGQGPWVWDVTGRRYVDWFPGLSSVILGHGHPAVAAAVARRLADGSNFQLPARYEAEAAELFLGQVARADMVKFTKDGSAANDAALRLARHATGRRLVARCGASPFLSYSDWFIGATAMRGGCLPEPTADVLVFEYDDLESLRALFERHPDGIAAVILEPLRFVDPSPEFLPGVRDLCDRYGTVLVFDEVVSGLRYGLGGAQHVLGVTPDLTTWGKAIANGLPLAALSGRRPLMDLGDSVASSRDPGLFLLSTTFGGEGVALAAMMATVSEYQAAGVAERLNALGAALRAGVEERATAHGLADAIQVQGRACFLTIACLDLDGQDSRRYRTQLYRELIRRGVLYRGIFSGTSSHDGSALATTLSAVDDALAAYARFVRDPGHQWMDPLPTLVDSPIR